MPCISAQFVTCTHASVDVCPALHVWLREHAEDTEEDCHRRGSDYELDALLRCSIDSLFSILWTGDHLSEDDSYTVGRGV